MKLSGGRLDLLKLLVDMTFDGQHDEAWFLFTMIL